MMGWKCPVCGRGLSPYMPVCPCGGMGQQSTYGTTTNECDHAWVTYGLPAPHRRCIRCGTWAPLPEETGETGTARAEERSES
jgi:hypothetical protein